MYNLEFEDIFVGGELKKRQDMSFMRMQEEQYQLENFFKPVSYEWQGDHEGRSLLALVMTARATHQLPHHLDAIMKEFPKHLNEQGFLGGLFQLNNIDEQQLAGHSWLLRGLIEHYRWKQSEQSLQMIHDIVENLYLKGRGHYKDYPTGSEDRKEEGEAAGFRNGNVVNGWALSTDGGCAFIALDGVTAAYELLHTEELRELIEEMIGKFMELDFAGLKLQTHATLTGLRGVIRYYEITQDPKLLEYAQTLFQQYLETATTAHFANYNWFGRPLWTEPCAIIDSFIIAVKLWVYTRKEFYVELAHKIYFNAIGYAQRPNGGFGCDHCAGAEEVFLAPGLGAFEAYWCCTMRGGDGISLASKYIYWLKDNSVHIAFYHENKSCLRFEDGSITLEQKTDYPINGKVRLHILEADCINPKKIYFYMPAYAEEAHLCVNGMEVDYAYEDGFVSVEKRWNENDTVEFTFSISLYQQKQLNKTALPGYVQFFHGPLLLGVQTKEQIKLEQNDLLAVSDGKYEIAGNTAVLEPVGKLAFYSLEEAKKNNMQVLF